MVMRSACRLSRASVGVGARFGAGVPCKQYKLIHNDGLRISTYVARTLDGVARTSHLRRDNYFYYSCCTGAALPWPCCGTTSIRCRVPSA